MAGEDLLCHLDGDVTLLSPLVQIQQVSSKARGQFQNSACGEVEMNHVKGQGEGDSEQPRECDTHNKGMGVCLCGHKTKRLFP